MSVLSPEPLALLPLPEPALPTLRLLPIPISAPPYDDELDVPPPPLVRLAPLRSLLARPLHLVSPAPTAKDTEQARTRTPSNGLPDARPFAHAMVQGLLEVQAGLRPLQQLQATTSAELYEQLEGVVLVRRRLAGSRPVTSAVRSLHVQQRDDGVAEVCARVQRGPRDTAVALRLEGVDGRWQCTELSGL